MANCVENMPWQWTNSRVYRLCMYAGMIKFMECILLAMAFVNALNETARDCDVYRMFSRGKGSARGER